MALPTEQTLLVMSTIGVTLYSARGLQEDLKPIQQAAVIRRSINFVPHNLAPEGAKKYSLVISCTDMNVPAIDGVWPGLKVIIHPAHAELSYKTSGGTRTRPAVSGSSRTKGDYTFYRPTLYMMVVGQTPSQNAQEYAASRGWSIEFEEIGILSDGY